MGKTRFLCEFCGREVPYNIEECPFCGKVFTAVKCPVCHKTGTPEQFMNGCPRCGYMTPQAEEFARPEKIKKRKSVKKRDKRKPLPSWFYLLSGIGLIVALVILIIIYIFRFMVG
ncbi:MAG: hypothetical protein JW969_06610 [Spirochaetales bacterium]|nr:hypothetical protein [Spirochaetales bacterium]